MKVGPYFVYEELGRGAAGVVYRAAHEDTGAFVAVKMLATDPRMPLTSASRAAAEGAGPGAVAIDAIRREVQALRRLTHPGIVAVVDSGVDAGVPWFAMELVEGEPIVAHARRFWNPVTAGVRPRIDDANLRRVLTLLRRVSLALAHVHGEGLVHRDLSAANLLVRAGSAQPVLVDFGVVVVRDPKNATEAAALTLHRAGTASVMAPEQIAGDVVDARADLYAFGCLCMRLLTGADPFSARNPSDLLLQHLHAPPPLLEDRVAAIPAALQALVSSLLEKHPAHRLGHAVDVAAALLALGADVDDDGPPPRPTLYHPRFVGRETLMAEVGARIAAVDGAGALVLLQGHSGIGKTRLAKELARRIAKTGARVLVGPCNHGPSLQPFHDALGTRGGADDVLAALHRLTTAAPLVLLLDDLEQADEDSRAFLAALVAGAALATLDLIVLATSSVAPPELQKSATAPALVVDVGPLDDGAVGHMLADALALAPPARVQPQLVEALVPAARGIPALLIEGLRTAAARGVLIRDGAGWHLRPSHEQRTDDVVGVVCAPAAHTHRYALRTTQAKALLDRRRAVDDAEASGDTNRLVAACTALAEAQRHAGLTMAALESARRALQATTSPTAAAAARSLVLAQLSALCLDGGDVRRARGFANDSVRLGRDGVNVHLLGVCALREGLEARALLAEAVALLEKEGARAQVGAARVDLAEALLAAGQTDEAVDAAGLALLPVRTAPLLRQCARIWRLAGRHAGARALLEEAIVVDPQAHNQGLARIELALVERARGALAAARIEAQAALRLLDGPRLGGGDEVLAGSTADAALEALFLIAELDQSEPLLDEAEARARTLFDLAMLLRCACLRGQWALRGGQGAAAHLDAARSLAFEVRPLPRSAAWDALHELTGALGSRSSSP